MDTSSETLPLLWRDILRKIDVEVRSLSVTERGWIGSGLREIGDLQEKMHACFSFADGEAACTRCLGACCERGKHHFTLVNLLGFLMGGTYPPPPDFTRTCPFLGERGCVLEVARRPYNCVSFLCETIEERLSPARLKDFYRREARLRSLYLEFDRRYAGSSLRGLLIRAERMEGRPFLVRIQGAESV